ncbi:MFS transporter [Streptomyces sp. ME02-6991-2A]|uniref:MFS transporter n=1 Tax=Streptomyces sp. ME02-6991-2A TaxID=3028677 RepID=UPI0029A88FA6|nr:MFS transporter [Streptomyces sp. ME02-6991-2A]MDX3376361.1 MFS transporter [Streptomyces sp. ME02-6991-2A]
MADRHSSLRAYLAGALAARTGDDMAGPALLLAALALTGSATGASSLLAAVTVSAAVGGPVLGALLDRAARPGRLLAGALLLYAAGLAVILGGLGRFPFAVTLLVAVVAGLLGPALSGGWTAQLPRAVPGERLPRANALDAMTFGVAGLAGPALAGGVAEASGAPTAVVVAAVLIGAAAPAAWRLPAPAKSAATSRPAPLTGLVASGVRAVLGSPPLARATLTSVLSCAAQGLMIACLPLLGERALGGAGFGAALLSGAALSALAANAVFARHPCAVAPDTVLWAAPLLQAAALALAATGRPAALVVAVIVVGVAEGPQLTALFAVRHREAPDRLRSQVFTTGASLKITGFAVGAAAAGPLAGWSLPGALLVAAGTAALAAPAFFAVRTADTAGTSTRA